MTTITVQAALALAMQCVPPSVAPIMVGIAQHESGLDPAAEHLNTNGTWDVGIAQVNSANFGWLGLTMESALDPCSNLAAGAKVLFAKYNGNPPDAVRAAYAAAVEAKIRALGTPSPASVPPSASVDDAPENPPIEEASGISDRPTATEDETFLEGDKNGH